MKEQVHHLYKAMLFIVVILLQGCGSSSDEAKFSITADVNEAHFSSEFLQPSTDSVAIQVNFDGEGLLVGYAPELSPVAWLEYRSENLTETSATIYLDVINAEFFQAGTYTTTIRLATSNDDASNFAFHDVDITLFIWDLTVDSEKINYSATLGDTSIEPQTIAITSEANSWQASVDADWLSLDVTSGSGNGTITVTPDITSFTASGLQQANLILTESTTGNSKSIPVELALDNIYLYADRTAISFTSAVGISALTATVAINNEAEAVSWQASTDANWLNLTVLSEGQLQITADPNIAPLNQVSSAQIAIAADQNLSAIEETITVNFYNSDLVVEDKVLAPLVINDNEILASPLMPVFYVAVGNQLLTYQQYTGALQSRVTVSPENTVLEQLIIHPNGDYLLAKASESVTDNGETTAVVHRYKIMLSDHSIVEILDADIDYEPIAIVRLSGRYFVVTQALEFADENLQVLFWDAENAYFTTKLETANQANTLFALDANAASLKRYTAQVNDFGDEPLIMTLTHEYRPELLSDGDLIYDFMVTNDEANIYMMSATSEWLSFNGEAFSDNGLLVSDENVVTLFLEKNANDQANYLRIDTTSEQGFYLETYDTQQAVIASTPTLGSQPTEIILSGDSQQLIINVDTADDAAVNSQIELVTVSP